MVPDVPVIVTLNVPIVGDDPLLDQLIRFGNAARALDDDTVSTHVFATLFVQAADSTRDRWCR